MDGLLSFNRTNLESKPLNLELSKLGKQLLIAPIWNRNRCFCIAGLTYLYLLIAPIWNRNQGVIVDKERFLAFNRTNLESKLKTGFSESAIVELLIAPIWNRN